jgi:hypothetical protein
MPVIRESIAVEARLDVVRDAWPYFVDWVLVGQRKMLCTEIACVRAAHDGHVTFEPFDEGRTRVAFHIDSDGVGIDDEVLAQRLRQDLMLFRDYVEGELLSRRERGRIEKAKRGSDSRRSKEKAPSQPSDADHVSSRPSRTAT